MPTPYLLLRHRFTVKHTMTKLVTLSSHAIGTLRTSLTGIHVWIYVDLDVPTVSVQGRWGSKHHCVWQHIPGLDNIPNNCYTVVCVLTPILNWTVCMQKKACELWVMTDSSFDMSNGWMGCPKSFLRPALVAERVIIVMVLVTGVALVSLLAVIQRPKSC